MYHEDMYMWLTINSVLPDAKEDIKESIYEGLCGSTWTIDMIEKMAAAIEKERLLWN